MLLLKKTTLKTLLYTIALSILSAGLTHALPENYTTNDLLNEIVPTIKITDPEEVKRQGYKPQLGDIIFREGIHEMGKYYTFFFNEDYTHSSIVIQIHPEVIVADCTKENMHSGVGETTLTRWSLKARRMQVMRPKNITPRQIEKIREFIHQAKIDGVLFDRTWDMTLAHLSETNTKRRMYCTIFIRNAFKHADIDLVPKPYVEYIPIRQLLMIAAGVRSTHWQFITINQLRTSPLLKEITKFKIKPVTIRENIRVRSNITGDLDDIVFSGDKIPLENPDPREMVMSYEGETIILQPNPLHEIRYRNIPERFRPPNPFKGLAVRQQITDFGHGIDSLNTDEEHNSQFEIFDTPDPIGNNPGDK